jgi:hypothetical protein
MSVKEIIACWLLEKQNKHVNSPVEFQKNVTKIDPLLNVMAPI